MPHSSDAVGTLRSDGEQLRPRRRSTLVSSRGRSRRGDTSLGGAANAEPKDSSGEERDEQQIMRGLQERGVLVRGGSALGSSTPALRVTYGLPEENARFLDALGEVL